MCQSVYTEVEKLTASIHPGIVKRAGMASTRIIRKLPELSSFFKKALNRMLSSSKHAVVSAGVTLAIAFLSVICFYLGAFCKTVYTTPLRFITFKTNRRISPGHFQ